MTEAVLKLPRFLSLDPSLCALFPFPSCQGNDQRLYEFIVRHFLACCSRDAKGQETTVEIDIAKERFVAHGLMILERNYLEVYPYEKWSDKVSPSDLRCPAAMRQGHVLESKGAQMSASGL